MLVFSISAESFAIQMMQSLTMVFATVGDTVTINYQASQSIGSVLAWYQQKLGETPKDLV